MVLRVSEISSHGMGRNRLTRDGRGGHQESRVYASSPPLPLGIGFVYILNNNIWDQILTKLEIPHFSHTKRLDLIHQRNIPIIYGNRVQPIINVNPLLFVEQESSHSLRYSKRLYTNRCEQCLEENMIYDSRLDLLVCSYCGIQSIFEPVYAFKYNNRRQNVSRKFSSDFHKRVIHFRSWLRRLQGKERNRVTKDIINAVKHRIQSQNNTGIYYWNVRNSLKALGMQKYYPHCVFIMSEIRGKPLFNLSRDQENRLVEMFLQLQNVFSALQQKRVNMLSYPFVIKKLCELKGWHKLSKVIPTLKSHTRIMLQDNMWRIVCQQKGWKFKPTPPWSALETRDPSCRLR